MNSFQKLAYEIQRGQILRNKEAGLKDMVIGKVLSPEKLDAIKKLMEVRRAGVEASRKVYNRAGFPTRGGPGDLDMGVIGLKNARKNIPRTLEFFKNPQGKLSLTEGRFPQLFEQATESSQKAMIQRFKELGMM